jgi:SAM-dependent methyltransferase
MRGGALWRLQPIRRDFGWGHGQCIDRFYIEAFLAQHSEDIRGRVLEIQDDTYTVQFGGDRVTRSDVLHVAPDNPHATIVADLANAADLESEAFDCIIMVQTLQFIFDPRAALRTVYRMLKPGGVLLATAAGITQVSRYDMQRWGEYWRFTTLSLSKLLEELVPSEAITVQAYGNVLTTVGALHGLLVQELNREEIEFHDPDYEQIIVVRLAKPAQADWGAIG